MRTLPKSYNELQPQRYETPLRGVNFKQIYSQNYNLSGDKFDKRRDCSTAKIQIPQGAMSGL
ncbi:MAG: hypothetical protein BAJATHORv1_20312 [Candidatus Thorarchaeota archaeon]|nr:MAG: hypothetical protein BAJATHORv1_20312 [Candidatus Thorarchaeota archaeon]